MIVRHWYFIIIIIIIIIINLADACNCCSKENEASTAKELDELREFTHYEKKFRDDSILQHQEVRLHDSLSNCFKWIK